MAESTKDKVAIVGMGCTRFGEHWDKDINDLIYEATFEALEDAGADIKDIQAVWLGSVWGSQSAEGGGIVTGSLASAALSLQYLPVTRVENACGTGAESIRGAAYAIGAGAYDVVLVIGVEKLKDVGFGGLGVIQPGRYSPVYGMGGTAPGRYAMAATRYFARYGLSAEQGKKMLAMVSVKSHHNGARNPRAHLQREITVEQAMSAPIIAWPLGLFDCCGVTDGAAAAVLCRASEAKSFRKDYITIKGLGIAAGPGWGKERTDYDYTSWPETEYAARYAYREAGIRDPRKELDLAEVHDCFSIAEVIAVESLGICEKGHGREDIESGAWTQEGEIPINISGGLKSFGHPLGASGCREVYEFYKQYQGKAEKPSRQLKNPRLGLAHNQGGHPGKFVAGVTIIGAP
ncbi:MAG: acetyl-CoA acetyltransferase [Chloroflexota bacterium]